MSWSTLESRQIIYKKQEKIGTERASAYFLSRPICFYFLKFKFNSLRFLSLRSCFFIQDRSVYKISREKNRTKTTDISNEIFPEARICRKERAKRSAERWKKLHSSRKRIKLSNISESGEMQKPALTHVPCWHVQRWKFFTFHSEPIRLSIILLNFIGKGY